MPLAALQDLSSAPVRALACFSVRAVCGCEALCLLAWMRAVRGRLGGEGGGVSVASAARLLTGSCRYSQEGSKSVGRWPGVAVGARGCQNPCNRMRVTEPARTWGETRLGPEISTSAALSRHMTADMTRTLCMTGP
jgi:hypothetical protein